MLELVELLRSIIGTPIPSTSNTITVVDAGITTVTTTAVGYDLEYAVMATLVVLFFMGLFKLIDNFQKSFGGKK